MNRFEPARKRMRTAKNREVEVSSFKWIRQARNQNIILTGAVLQEKQKVLQKHFVSMVLHAQMDGCQLLNNTMELSAKGYVVKSLQLIRKLRFVFCSTVIKETGKRGIISPSLKDYV